MRLSIIVPTFNEASNVEELVSRVAATLRHGTADAVDAELIFVDDSTDDTPERIHSAAASTTFPVRLIHREHAEGGLGGAVLAGMHAAESDLCLVMDGDLQHPPEDIPRLLARFDEGGADVVVASRYVADGSSSGLADRTRVWVSRLSTALTKAMFPLRLRNVSDPMTGFFLVDRQAVDIQGLHPRGFKILLEILARTSLRIAEVPFTFAERFAGTSKASVKQGIHFFVQLAALRFGKMSRFAVIGAGGAVVNLAIVWALLQFQVHYLVAAVVAAEVTIIGNFLLQERYVFNDMAPAAQGVWTRFAKSFTFNNAEAVIRIPILALLVDGWHLSAVIATAITLALAFVARFMFHSLVVYAPSTGKRSKKSRVAETIDALVVSPGEL
ncbi:glycosyltransferase [Microbacterium kribbense]|uniref:Glycosyltransferase n=1 Tax=Microbacterium kribbense TaxID=433645 RepID=A0ABP7GLB5_9MICO